MIDKPCLHCAIARVVRAHYDKYGEKTSDGITILDATEAIARLCEVIADLGHEMAAGGERQRFQGFARECMEAAFLTVETGEDQVVDLGGPEVLH